MKKFQNDHEAAAIDLTFSRKDDNNAFLSDDTVAKLNILLNDLKNIADSKKISRKTPLNPVDLISEVEGEEKTQKKRKREKSKESSPSEEKEEKKQKKHKKNSSQNK